MRNVILFLLLFISFASFGSRSAQDTILVSQISNLKEGLNLEPYMKMYEDKSKKLTILDFRTTDYNSKFTDYNPKLLPKKNAIVWVKLSIKNTDLTSEQELIFGSNQYDYITFYAPNKYSLSTECKTGNKIPIKAKIINKDANSYVSLFVKANSTLICFAKIQIDKEVGYHFVELKPTLYSREKFDDSFKNQIVFGSIYFGIAFIMFIYNVLLFFIVRDKTYLYYILYTASMLAFGFAVSGEINAISGIEASFNMRLNSLSGLLVLIFYIDFSRELFHFKNNFPIVDKIIRTCYFASIFAFILALFDFEGVVVPISFIATLLSMGLVVSLAIVRVYRGFAPGRYFLVATVLDYIFITIMALQMLQILPAKLFGLSAPNYFDLAASLQLAFFSLALGAKINLFKSEIIQKQLEQEQILREEEHKRNELIRKQNEELEIKVQERTLEISERNEELLQQQEEIGLINDQLTTQSKKVNLQNTQILDSLNYARRIQSALLPSKEQLELELTNHFVIWHPKNIVSGDFYWYKKMDNHIVIVVADCTGHGVPGAFMSMLGVAFLNEIVRDGINKKASDILEMLRDYVKLSLKQSGGYNENKDGMDISLCIIHKESLQMEHAGAHNPVYIIRKNNLPEVDFKNKDQIKNLRVAEVKKHIHENRTLYHITSDLQPIGVFVKEFPFNNKIIQLYPEDKIYLATDGITDQIGGEKSQKFKTQALKDCLLDTSDMDLTVQAEELERIIQTWKGKQEQIDDMLLLGFQI